MTDIVKKRLRALEHATTVDRVLELLNESVADSTLDELMLESNHEYIIDGSSRGYMAARVILSSKHNVHLDVGTGRLSCCDIGRPEEHDCIPHELQTALNEIFEQMFDSTADVDVEFA